MSASGDAAGRRNVVVITYDSLRADHCGPWGYERDTTPNMDRMAEDGVVFENAIAPASRTNPSMAGILTGEPMVVRDHVAEPEFAREHLARYGTLAEELSAGGYATGAFCPNAYASQFYGFDRGFDTFEDFLFDSSLYQDLFEEHLGDSSLYATLRNVRNFVRRQEAFKTWDSYVDDMEDWVHERAGDGDDPFFLWAFSLDTHFPYLTPRSYRQWSGLVDQYYYNWRCNQLIDQFEIDLSETERRKIIDIYDDSIRFGDALIAELRERLAEYDPVFVVFGDHGEAFGERGVYGHFFPDLYDENVHVPLVIDGEGINPGTVRKPTSLLDLPRIVREVAGVGGRSFDLEEYGDDWVIATDYDGRNDRNLTAVRTQEWSYIRTESGGGIEWELFDLNGGDPLDNLAGGEREVEDPLRAIAERRVRHEEELLGIQSWVGTVDIDSVERSSSQPVEQ